MSQSADEQRLRIDLAACYRLVALFGWDDIVFTHISVKLPGDAGFLINPMECCSTRSPRRAWSG